MVLLRRVALVVDLGAGDVDALKAVANEVVKCAMFGEKCELGLFVCHCADGDRQLCQVGAPSWELIDWLRVDDEPQRSQQPWPARGAGSTGEGLWFAVNELHASRRGKASLESVVYLLTDDGWRTDDAYGETIRRMVPNEAREAKLRVFQLACQHKDDDKDKGEDAASSSSSSSVGKKSRKHLRNGASSTKGSYRRGDRTYLVEAARKVVCAGDAPPASRTTPFEFVLADGLVANCHKSKVVKKKNLPSRSYLEAISFDIEEDDELNEVKKEVETTTHFYLKSRPPANDDDAENDDDDDDAAVTGAEIDARHVKEVYSYGGKHVPISAVELVDDDPDDVDDPEEDDDLRKKKKRSPAAFSPGPGSAPPPPKKKTTKKKKQWRAVGAAPRAEIAHRARCGFEKPDTYDEVIEAADARAEALLKHLAAALRASDQALLLRHPPEKAGSPERLCVLTPLGTSGGTFLSRVVPWLEETIQAAGPLQALFARGTVQGRERRRKYLDDDDDDDVQEDDVQEDDDETKGEPTKKRKTLRSAAEALIEGHRLKSGDDAPWKTLAASKLDSQRLRVWEYLRRVATLRGQPTDAPSHQLVPPAESLKDDHLREWREGGALLDASKAQVTARAFRDVAGPILRRARDEREARKASANYSFRDAAKNFFSSDKDQGDDVVPEEKDDNTPALVSTVAPTSDFEEHLADAIDKADDAKADDLRKAMQRVILAIVDHATGSCDDPDDVADYLERAADCVRCLKDGSDPSKHHSDPTCFRPHVPENYDTFVREAIAPRRASTPALDDALTNLGLAPETTAIGAAKARDADDIDDDDDDATQQYDHLLLADDEGRGVSK